jgi:hypothetical protein
VASKLVKWACSHSHEDGNLQKINERSPPTRGWEYKGF